ncbi:hypothetical protein CASFOL_009412 [Castilleja foliolosa]|uniref:FH2 domain-containing protein n=1 Tax=Castilleja foliolosa TaxID=1961234 RepID=A0ABD3DX93_9LAMI
MEAVKQGSAVIGLRLKIRIVLASANKTSLEPLLGSRSTWTAYLISVLYIEYRCRKEKECLFEVLGGLLVPYWKAVGLAFNCSFLLFGSVIQLIACARTWDDHLHCLEHNHWIPCSWPGNPDGFGPELFETLVKMAPSKEEEIKLKKYDDESSKLGPAERFLRVILDIPFAFKRVEAMLYRAKFNTEVEYLRKSFQIIEEASEELKNSKLFLKLLEAVLRTGYRMNDDINCGSAKAFK